MVIMEGRLQDVEEVFTLLVKETNKMVLEIIEKKTEFMIVPWKPYNENGYVKLGTYNFEIMRLYISYSNYNR